MRPRLEILDAPLVERILDEALSILEAIGVLVVELFQRLAGARARAAAEPPAP